jgi:C-terminal processing protease CtpA/Prc
MDIRPTHKSEIFGRGIMPDVEIKNTFKDWIENKDPQMDWIEKDIEKTK